MDNVKKLPYIITMCSGKGGVGKSVLAANLANLLSMDRKVLVWDADMHFPNQHLIIGTEPPMRLKDVYAGNISVEAAVHAVTENFHLLADMPATGDNEPFDPSPIQSVYDELISNFDYDVIIIDTHAGVSMESLQCCGLSDLVSVVITDEPTSLLDAYGLIKILIKIKEKENIGLLVNNVIDMEDADDMREKLNQATDNFLKIKLDFIGYVPYDRIVRQSIIRQELFSNIEPENEATKAVEMLKNKVVAKTMDMEYNFQE